jgi:DinB superfamily
MSQSAVSAAEDLRTEVTRTVALLRGVSEAEASRRRAPGSWSAKEIIGHLIDSAANNHARFVRAQLEPDLVSAGYDQEQWVKVQAYQEASWSRLLELWSAYNLHIAHVMESASEDATLRPRARHNLDQIAWTPVSADQPATLDYFMSDYVGHLRHHLRQVAELLTPNAQLPTPKGKSIARGV